MKILNASKQSIIYSVPLFHKCRETSGNILVDRDVNPYVPVVFTKEFFRINCLDSADHSVSRLTLKPNEASFGINPSKTYHVGNTRQVTIVSASIFKPILVNSEQQKK